MRLGNLYYAFSKYNDITMLTSTDFGARYEEIVHTPTFREMRFPKDEFWRTSYATLERSGVHGDLSGLAFALAVSEPACPLRQRARELVGGADVVVHEFPFSEPIFNDGCSAIEVYNSHNFEASLLSSIVTGEGFETALLKLLKLEGNLVARANRVYATSTADAEKFRLFYGAQAAKIEVCPNGFDHMELAPVVAARDASSAKSNARPRLLFTGSGHHPNVEGAEFLITTASELSDCDILLAGGLCGAFSNRQLPANVILLGPFDQATKLQLLTEADLFLNPVVLGSGTSLKALEALGAALPMVSTPEGVRGLDLEPGIHCEIVPRVGFVSGVRRMLDDPDRKQAIGQAGLTAALNGFSWQEIARNLNATLFKPPGDARPARPFVLALNDYAVLQPGSGGIARVRNLLSQIDCDVALVSFGSTFEVGLISPGVLHATIPKTTAHYAFEQAVNDAQPMSVNDGVASLFALSNRALTTVVSAIAQRAQAVIFEHPYMAPLLDIIASVNPDIPVIYSAHNVEATHKNTILRGHSIHDVLTGFIAELEERLASQANLIVCCTEADVAYFSSGSTTTIPVLNGCDIPVLTHRTVDQPVRQYDGQQVGFLGSGHGPNVEAGEFIVRELACYFPEVQFEFIGSVCTALSQPLPANVVLHGLVSEAAKSEIMFGWDVALNPILSGGGSSLKLPDYLAHGVATISTPAGARGFAVAENDVGQVVSRDEFRSALGLMLEQPENLLLQRMNARSYAIEQLSWAAVTAPYREVINNVLLPQPATTRRPKILVVTYRYTEPSLGGAEEYLIEVLKRIRPRCDRLDLAAVDLDYLTNHHHFGCRISAPPGGAARRIAELFDTAHFFPAEELPEPEMLVRARNLERAWTREERHLFAPFAAHLAGAERLRLFGGFFWPENHGGIIRRWTSPEFSFLVPAGARVFTMSAYAAAEKTLTITLMRLLHDGTMEPVSSHTQTIAPHFTMVLTLPRLHSDTPTLLLCEVDEHSAPEDHRPFGVLLEGASVQVDRDSALNDTGRELSTMAVSHADLSEQLDEELRTGRFADWVATLHGTALVRPAAMEEDFAAIRGPHSPTLHAWLAEHASGYDTVFVQGIPFDIIPSTVETLAALPAASRPRIVTLPHFHGDDRFYHWRRYTDCFAAADATLLFSQSIADELGPSDRFVVVPGGGVRADEHGDPTAEQRFRDVHADTTPFYLVLGRKTASKGYQQAVRAQQLLRNAGFAVDLVLIGPDEDGLPVSAPGVSYLGRQPREVIRGALGACLGLVTMSRSESFGIVLCEAWLFGKPVIANRSCYSFRELVRDGETGLLVTTDEELAEAMRRLAKDEQGRARMGQAGFGEVLENYTWEKVADACFGTLVSTT